MLQYVCFLSNRLFNILKEACVIQFLSKLSSQRTIYTYRASLGIRKPHELKVPELKQWLACRGASRSGHKAALIERVNDYIRSIISGSLTQIVGFILN